MVMFQFWGAHASRVLNPVSRRILVQLTFLPARSLWNEVVGEAPTTASETLALLKILAHIFLPAPLQLQQYAPACCRSSRRRCSASRFAQIRRENFPCLPASDRNRSATADLANPRSDSRKSPCWIFPQARREMASSNPGRASSSSRRQSA